MTDTPKSKFSRRRIESFTVPIVDVRGGPTKNPPLGTIIRFLQEGSTVPTKQVGHLRKQSACKAANTYYKTGFITKNCKAIYTLFEQPGEIGWGFVSKDGKDPTAVIAPPVTASPQPSLFKASVFDGIVPTLSQRKAVRVALEGEIDNETGRYCSGLTDEIVADRVGVSVAAVADIRLFLYGEPAAEPVAEPEPAPLATVESIRAMAASLTALADEMEKSA